MKHIKLILISLVCVIATMTKAQESSSQNKFFEDGKSWLWARHHYKLPGDSIGFYYKKDTTYWTETVVEDTIVDGHHAKKLLIGDSLGVPKEPHHYKIYLEEEGVIYEYGSHPENYDSLCFCHCMDFNLHVGDSVYHNSIYGYTYFMFEVMNEETINVCGIERRKLTLGNKFGNLGYWVEGIGANVQDCYMHPGWPISGSEGYWCSMVKCFQDGVCIFTADDFLASTDGIKDVAVSEKDKALSEDASLYDLSGRKVTGTPRRGIYIKGGRKVLVK